jgi:hypothetical protein
VSFGEPGAASTATAVEGLAIPEDDSTPNTPLQVLLERGLQAANSDDTLGADLLGFGQFGRFVGEEELVAPLLGTSAFLLQFSQLVVHVETSSGGCFDGKQKAAGIRRPNGSNWSSHHMTRGRRRLESGTRLVRAHVQNSALAVGVGVLRIAINGAPLFDFAIMPDLHGDRQGN